VCTRDYSCITVDQIDDIYVKLAMTNKVDNKGAKDLVNNCIIGGRTRHFGVRLNYLCELKEDGVIQVDWIRSEEIHSDKKCTRRYF
jgi:hypothetical protein